MKIVIFDDDINAVHQLEEILKSFTFRKSTLKINSFTDFNSLQKHMATDKADVYLLDIMMPGPSGIEIGHYIRSRHRNAFIIYISSSTEYTFAAFGVHAYQYLQKPVDRDLLRKTLSEVEDWIIKNVQARIIINTKEGMASVPVDDIMYVENISRAPVYTLIDRSQKYGVCNRGSFEDSVGELGDNQDFIHPHKSFFVNMYHVRGLEPHALIMDDGREIPISRVRFSDTKKAYLKFLAKGV